MPAQGRLGDKAKAPLCVHGCPACPHTTVGPGIVGSPDVKVNGLPALRRDDGGIHAACCGENRWRASAGSETVFINGKPVHRKGDATQHCGGVGQLIEGSPNVDCGSGVSEPAVRRDRASWRTDPDTTRAELAANAAAASSLEAKRAALRHAARSGAGLVKHDCTHCDTEVSVVASPDQIDTQRHPALPFLSGSP